MLTQFHQSRMFHLGITEIKSRHLQPEKNYLSSHIIIYSVG